MSGAFLRAVPRHLPNARITVDWFHIVPVLTRALDEVRKAESRIRRLPKHLRWGTFQRGEADRLMTNELKTMAELPAQRLDTATAWRIEQRLRWVCLAKTPQAARWRITRSINYAAELNGEIRLLKPMRQALQTLRNRAERVERRWTSSYINARVEGLNGLVQAARARARGHRNTETFVTMIYMIGSPAGIVLKPT
jgi:transposase